MKIKTKKLSVVILFLIAVICLPLTAFAENSKQKRLCLKYENAPEGTYYIDLLVNMGEDNTNYTQFNEPGQPDSDHSTDVNIYTSIGVDSQIAKYNEDGYVSFAVHSKQCKGLFRNTEGTEFYIDTEYSFNDVFDGYSWKAAYVDKEGNVLGVTDMAKEIETEDEPMLCADGSKLEYYAFKPLGRVFKGFVALMYVGAGLILAVVIGIVYLISRLHRRKGIPDGEINEELVEAQK